jgi:hypothetical protein
LNQASSESKINIGPELKITTEKDIKERMADIERQLKLAHFEKTFKATRITAIGNEIILLGLPNLNLKYTLEINFGDSSATEVLDIYNFGIYGIDGLYNVIIYVDDSYSLKCLLDSDGSTLSIATNYVNFNRLINDRIKTLS